MAETRCDRRPAHRKVRTRGVLQALKPAELSAVLRELLERHPDLRPDAEVIATGMMSRSSVEEVAEGVHHTVTSLDVEALHGRAGKQPWGYVEPVDAAWEILEEAVEGYLEDMTRRVKLGLGSAAEAICRGVVLGLYRAQEERSSGLLAWAPDFPIEQCGVVVDRLMSAAPAADRDSIRSRLRGALEDLAPDWAHVI